jgi:hypothetical protein
MTEEVKLTLLQKAKKNWLVIALASALVIMILVYIFWPIKTRKDTGINEGVVVIIDSLLQANRLLTTQQQHLSRTIDTVLSRVSERDARIIEKYFYRDNKIRSIDTASEPVLQGLWDDRYRP